METKETKCIFLNETLQTFCSRCSSFKDISYKHFFKIAIELGLNFIAIKTLEEILMKKDLGHKLYYVFSAFISTRSDRTNKEICDEIAERISQIENDDLMVDIFNEFKLYRECADDGCSHKIATTLYPNIKWQSFEESNDVILSNQDLLILVETIPDSSSTFASEIGLLDYYAVILNKFPTDELEWRRKVEIIFKGREFYTYRFLDLLNNNYDQDKIWEKKKIAIKTGVENEKEKEKTKKSEENTENRSTIHQNTYIRISKIQFSE